MCPPFRFHVFKMCARRLCERSPSEHEGTLSHTPDQLTSVSPRLPDLLLLTRQTGYFGMSHVMAMEVQAGNVRNNTARSNWGYRRVKGHAALPPDPGLAPHREALCRVNRRLIRR